MKKNVGLALINLICFSCLQFFSCKDEIEVKDNGPAVIFITDTLRVDMNQANLPSVIAVVNSLTGLREVSTYVVKKGGVLSELEFPVTSFFNLNSYSINRNPSYDENVIGFKVIAEDITGQIIESTLPIKVNPLKNAPKILFSLSDGTTTENVDYIEDEEMPHLLIKITGEEELQYITISQIAGGSETSLSIVPGKDTLYFENKETEYRIYLDQLQDVNETIGENYVFPDNISGIRVYTASGVKEKPKLASGMLVVNYIRSKPMITILSEEEKFNGLTDGETVGLDFTISGYAQLKSYTISYLDANGGVLIDPAPVTEAISGNTITITKQIIAKKDIKFIRIEAVDVTGKVAVDFAQLHIGYRYFRLKVTTSASNNQSYFSSTLEKILDPCSAKETWSDIDLGFGTWTKGSQVAVCRLDRADKLGGTCGSAHTTTPWDNRNLYNMYYSQSITTADFDKATVSMMKLSSLKNGEATNQIAYLIAGTEANPYSTNNVVIYDRKDGKRVMIAGDGLEENSPLDVPIFYIKVKVEL